MNDLSKLSDAALKEIMEQAIRAHDRAQGELRSRVHARLSAAYGHELQYVGDIWAGTEHIAGEDRIVWCFYCGERPGWHREHKIPKSRGGTDHPSNIARACQTCNSRKNTMTVEEYRSSLERRTGQPHLFFGERQS